MDIVILIPVIAVVVFVVLVIYYSLQHKQSPQKGCKFNNDCPSDSFCDSGVCKKQLGAKCNNSSECPSYLSCLPSSKGTGNECLLKPLSACTPGNSQVISSSTITNSGCSGGYVCDQQYSICLPALGTTCLPAQTLPEVCSDGLICGKNNLCLLENGSICENNNQCDSETCYFSSCRALSGEYCNDPKSQVYDNTKQTVLCINGVSCVNNICV